jgi:hypothetical protein
MFPFYQHAACLPAQKRKKPASGGLRCCNTVTQKVRMAGAR